MMHSCEYDFGFSYSANLVGDACRLNEEVVLILVDGPAILPAAQLRDPMWYALFFFLKGLGTLPGSMEEFVSWMTAAETPQGQLEMLKRFQPEQDRMSQEEWDVAIYCVLARAAQIKGLISGQSETRMTMSSVTLMQSADAIGQLFDRETKACCGTAMQHIKLMQPHGECMLSEQGLLDIARYITSTVQSSLRLT